VNAFTSVYNGVYLYVNMLVI